jgi:hypothetical protein
VPTVEGEIEVRKRIVVLGLALMVLLTLGLVNAPAASAAPITCPGGQTATKTSTGWDCVNNGGNPSNSEDPKNPNVRKGFF